MKTIQKTIWLFTIATALVACSKDEGQLPEESAGCAVVQEFINENVKITEPTTWTADRVYQFKSTHVIIESELTIEPGTVMKFDHASAMYIRKDKEQGRIIANGTADKHIVFTSYTDSKSCGNTQTDGDDAQPQRGDWGGIAIHAGNKHSFTYVDILYAGGPAGEGMASAIELSYKAGVDFTFDHCVIAHTRGEVKYLNPRSPGIYAAFNATFQVELPLPNFEKFRFTNNVFYDNDVPLQVNCYYSVDASNKFHNPDNPAEKNDRNVIHMFGYGSQEGNVTWGHTEVPYAYTGGYSFKPKSRHTITIGPNVIVKFPGVDAGINSYDDIRVINLHPTAILTSYLDDAHGGDSNGDGTNSSPKKSDWAGFLARTSYPNDIEIWAAGDNILYADRP